MPGEQTQTNPFILAGQAAARILPALANPAVGTTGTVPEYNNEGDTHYIPYGYNRNVTPTTAGVDVPEYTDDNPYHYRPAGRPPVGYDEAVHPDWTLKLGNSLKNRKAPELKLDKETWSAILQIVDEMKKEEKDKLINIYYIKLDLLVTTRYNDFLSTYGSSDEHEAVNHLSDITRWVDRMIAGAIIETGNWFYEEVALRAKQRYHIDYSKYKYYPRLKAKISYGDAELLHKILAVTYITRGIIICPVQ